MEENNSNPEPQESGMNAMSRVAKLPIVESTINVASEYYNKAKESNEMVNSVLSKAETTVKQAVDMSTPVTSKLETPLKKVDSLLCNGLDFVETNVPAIKLPPQEMYETTKNAVVNTVEPAIKTVYSMGEQVSSTVRSTFTQSTQKQTCCLHKDQPCPKTEDT